MSDQFNNAIRPRELSGTEVAVSAMAPDNSINISGTRVELCAVDPVAHSKALFDGSHNVEGADNLWTYTGYGPFFDVADFARWAGDCVPSLDPLFYVFIDRETGEPFGMASYLNIYPSHGCVEIGNIWIVPTYQRTRHASEAIFLMMEHAMDALHFRRLEWKCNAFNAASRRAATRFGFSFEGTFFRHLIVKGKNRDTAWFSIIAEEWPNIRANFIRWLSDENFNAEGAQKQRLSELNWT